VIARLGVLFLIIAALQGCGPKSTTAKPQGIEIAVGENGTVTYTGTDVTCAQLEAFMEKMAKASGGKIKPLPCREGLPPKKSN
jgi:hypothetical protein